LQQEGRAMRGFPFWRERLMDNERIRAICMALPHVKETVNWGHHLVYWAGDRDIGGKMFASTDLDGSGVGVLSFHCGAERFHELLEIDGMRPTPYSAKHFWVTMERWDVLRARQVEEELKRAYELIFAKLPKRTQTVLAMPEKERNRILRERKKVLAGREKEKKG
jgi:predicted DNA-binding protein (MmcQ/YjbR family)